MTTALPTTEEVHRVLRAVIDPELRQPITDLGMVSPIEVDPNTSPATIALTISLTVSHCPRKDDILAAVESTLSRAMPQYQFRLHQDVMSPAQRQALKEQLRGGKNQRTNPFTSPDTLTRIYAVVSGKGGVGKSTVTTNLAAGLAAQNLRVGVIDADIFGFSLPRLFGVEGAQPTRMDEMILPVVAHETKLISIGMFLQDNAAVAWRGPMISRAITQFFHDVYFGDLDVLLLDLPPGTGDIAITVAQQLPAAELLIVTTPQAAASEVAERAGLLAEMTDQKVAGVIENMAGLQLADGSTLDIFGSGGGQILADRLSNHLGYQVPLLATIPLDPGLTATSDAGLPLVLAAQDPPSPAAAALQNLVQRVKQLPRHLPGKALPLSPAAQSPIAPGEPKPAADSPADGRPGEAGQPGQPKEF